MAVNGDALLIAIRERSMQNRCSKCQQFSKSDHDICPKRYVKPLYKRFWDKVDKSGDCWKWTAGTCAAGYGRIGYEGRNVKAHRVSYAMHNGSIPKGLHVLHHCDNPRCVNPDHLYAGTDLDNSNDKHRRGRANVPIGERNSNSRLSEQDVVLIRELADIGTKRKALAWLFDVNKSCIDRVVTRKTWKHV